MEREELLEICEARGRFLLDIGAGPLAIIAASRYGCRVVNIDIDPEALMRERREIVERGMGENIIFLRADATDLPFIDASFDIVISYGALHHTPVERRERFIQEAFRVTGEKLCIAEYHRRAFPHDETEFKPVDPSWLEPRLCRLGRIERRSGEEMDVYICWREI